jgi:PKD repeat protein
LGSPANETFQLTNVGGQGQTFTGNITAPAGTNPGHYRLRARMTYSTAPTPCGSATYGEVEDYTVVIEGDILQASFTSDLDEICHGGQVHYFDNSVGNITSWSWTFPGGTPATSSIENPVVTYQNPGNFGVTLTVSDGTNSNTFTALEWVIVYPDPEQPATPSGPAELCQDAPNSTYNTNNAVGATGWTWDIYPASAGVITNNGPLMTIDWNASFTGTVQISVGCNNLCGQSPTSNPLTVTVLPLPGTSGTISGEVEVCWDDIWIYTVDPVADADTYEWVLDPISAGSLAVNNNQCTVTFGDTYQGNATLKVRGVNECGEGAWSPLLSILIDDCTGIDDLSQKSAISIYPNPNSGNFTMSYKSNFSGDVKVSVTTTTGIIVFSNIFKNTSADSPINIELPEISEGVYFLKAESENQITTEKIIVRR